MTVNFYIKLILNNVFLNKNSQINYFQSTGEDSNDCKISLSAAVPSIGGNVPELLTLNIKIKPKEIAPHSTQYFMSMDFCNELDEFKKMDRKEQLAI